MTGLVKKLEKTSRALKGKIANDVLFSGDYMYAKNSKSFLDYAQVRLPFTVNNPFTVSIKSLLSLVDGDGDVCPK